MASKTKRDFRCSVVHEEVKIHLRKKHIGGWRSKQEFFVQCDQSECQYVDENKPPCPLETSLYEEEIREREEDARRRSEESDYY